MLVSKLDAGLDDGSAEPLVLDLTGFGNDPLNRESQSIHAGIKGAQVLAEKSVNEKQKTLFHIGSYDNEEPMEKVSLLPGPSD